EWLETKHGKTSRRRSWRKLHLGLDLETGQIECSELTTDDIGDPSAVPDLLDQIDEPVHRFLADGAYDGAATRTEITQRFADVEIIIPPPKTAVPGPEAETTPTARDLDVLAIKAHGRMAWQKGSVANFLSFGSLFACCGLEGGPPLRFFQVFSVDQFQR
ncbi:MAG: transposase, partial [Roseobacter sp.]